MNGVYSDVLRHPVARALYLSSTLSAVGTWIGFAALLVLAYDRSGTVVSSATLFAVQGVASLVGSAVIGPRLDRVDRRRGLVGVYGSGAAALVLPLVADGVWPVYVAMAATGLLRPVAASLRYAVKGAELSDDHIRASVSLTGSTLHLVAAVGVAVGGAVSVLLSPEVAIAVDAATFALAAALVSRLPGGRAEARGGGVLGGFRAWTSVPSARHALGLVVAGSTVGALPEVASVAAADGSGWLPAVMSAQAFGTAAAAFFAGRDVTRDATVRMVALTVAALLLGAAVAGGHPSLLAVANFAMGVGFSFTVLAQGAFAASVDGDRLGVATASAITVVMVAEGLGAVVLGAVADRGSLGAAYLVAAAVVAGAVLALRRPRSVAPAGVV